MTEIDKKAIPTRLLWVDLEMTGLDPEHDVILEVAAVVTDFRLQPLADYKAIVRQDKAIVSDRMAQNHWWKNYPENQAEFIQKTSDQGIALPSARVEAELINLVRDQFGTEPAVLAGNSIHNDRNFIRHWWPRLDARLHYRMLDVSSWKVYMQGWRGVEFEKLDTHRADDDIQASIEELKYYIGWFKNNSEYYGS